MSETDGERQPSSIIIPEGTSRSRLILPHQQTESSSELIIPPRPTIVRPEPTDTQDYDTRASGLAVPRTNTQEIQAISNEQLLEFKATETPVPKSKRTMADALRAQANPEIFLFNAVASAIRKLNETEYEQVLQHVNPNVSEKNHYSTKDLEREQDTSSYYDRHKDETVKYTKSKPGKAETIALKIVEVMQDPILNPSLFINTLQTFLNEYRSENYLAKLPAMPDLIHQLNKLCDQYKTRPQLRSVIYTIIQGIDVPQVHQQDLLKTMDSSNDLNHPLAFGLATEIALSGSESDWLDEQDKRRKELLEMLDTDPQALYNNFGPLLAKSQKLLCATDIRNPPTGKVGFEIEFKQKAKTNRGSYRRQIPLTQNWQVGTDMRDQEVRRDGDKLAYNTGYIHDFDLLADWLRFEATMLKSVHFHLDRKTHPIKPTLNGLVEGEFMHGQGAIYKNPIGSWEIRGMNLPEGEGSFNPARMTDIIALHIEAAKPNVQQVPKDKIHTNSGEPLTMQHLEWGHLCQTLTTPEARLAALMSLHDKKMLSAISPLCFIHSYDQESIRDISTFLHKTLTDELDKQFAQQLPAIQAGTAIKDIWSSLSDYKGQLQLIKGLHYTPALLIPYLPLIFRSSSTEGQYIKGNTYELFGTSKEYNDSIMRYGFTDSHHTKINYEVLESMMEFPHLHTDILIHVMNNEENHKYKFQALQTLLKLPNTQDVAIKKLLTSSFYEQESIIIKLADEFDINKQLFVELAALENEGINIAILNALDHPAQLDFLLNTFLTSPNKNIKMKAVQVMISDILSNWKRIKEFAQTATDDEKEMIISRAERAYSKQIYTDAINLFINDSNPQLRQRIFKQALQYPLEYPEAFALACNNSDLIIRRAALKVILLHGQSLEYYLDRFRSDPDETIRKLSTVGGDLTDEEHLDAILRLLKEPNEELRDLASEQLEFAKIDSNKIGEFVITSNFKDVQDTLLSQLLLKLPESKNILVKIFNESANEYVRLYVINTFKSILKEHEDVLPMFQKAINDPSSQVRHAAIDAIMEMPKLDKWTLLKYTVNSDSYIRNKALDRLLNNE